MGSLSKSLGLILVALFLTFLVTLQPVPVKAQSKTIIVPDNYPTVGAAVGNATNGDTILARAGTYQESTLRISKTLSIIGEGNSNTTINCVDSEVWDSTINMLQPVSIAIIITANDVKISGFTINQIAI